MKALSNLCRITCVLFVCSTLFSCNPSKKFHNNLLNFMADKVVTDPELTSLKNTLPLGGCIIDGVQINNEESLIDYLHSKGITESAAALKLAAPIELRSLTIYLETSASMSGYSHSGNPAFTAPIIAIPNAVPANVTIGTNHIFGDKKTKMPIIKTLSKAVFESNLANGKIAKAESSPLDAIISLIVDSTDTQNASCLITDGIISGTNEEIIQDREFAIKNMPLLEQRVREAINKSANKDLDILMYRLETAFDGTYYDYRNSRHTLKVDNRPYFMMFFGHKSHLQNIETGLEDEAEFKYTDKFATWQVDGYQTVDHGIIYKVPTCMAQYVLNVGKRILTFDNNPKVPVDFKVRFNLTNLPEYYKNEFTLQNGLELFYVVNDIEVKVNQFIQNVSTYNATLNEYEAALQIDPAFFNEFSKNRVLYLRHKAELSNWWETKSADMDINMNTDPNNNTFALNKMMRGILNGYSIKDDKMKDAICISIQLEK